MTILRAEMFYDPDNDRLFVEVVGSQGEGSVPLLAIPVERLNDAAKLRLREVRDPARPQPADQVAAADAADRLAELRAKGWPNLTSAERAEVTQHALAVLGL